MPRPTAGSEIPPPRAFTLVELLVVIGVVTLVIGVLMPTLSAIRKRAQDATCKSQMREISRSLQITLNEEKVFPFFVFGRPADAWTARESPQDVLEKHLGDPNIIVCPRAWDGDEQRDKGWMAEGYFYGPGASMFLTLGVQSGSNFRERITKVHLEGRHTTFLSDRTDWHDKVKFEVIAKNWELQEMHFDGGWVPR